MLYHSTLVTLAAAFDTLLAFARRCRLPAAVARQHITTAAATRHSSLIADSPPLFSLMFSLISAAAMLMLLLLSFYTPLMIFFRCLLFRFIDAARFRDFSIVAARPMITPRCCCLLMLIHYNVHCYAMPPPAYAMSSRRTLARRHACPLLPTYACCHAP